MAAHLDVDAIAERVVARIREHNEPPWVDPKIHAEQHAFITAFIAATNARAARRERIKERIAGWAILGVLGGLATLLGAGFLQWISKGPK